MASKKKTETKTEEKGYQPKATARHAKITKTKQEEIDAFRNKISNDKHLAKKYEDNRRAEIKAMPKEERAAAKAELKDAISKRKEAERNDKAKLREMMHEERVAKQSLDKGPFSEDEWLNSGRKKKDKTKAEPIVVDEVPAEEPEPIVVEEVIAEESIDVVEEIPEENADIVDEEGPSDETDEKKS